MTIKQIEEIAQKGRGENVHTLFKSILKQYGMLNEEEENGTNEFNKF